MFSRNLLVVVLLLGSTSCLSQTSPPAVRWFMPEVGSFEVLKDTAQHPLNLVAVENHTHLREPMVWRLSAVELYFDEQERWGVRPAEITQAVIEEALFATGPYIQDEHREIPVLRVELQTFEGVYAATDVASCEIFAVYSDGEAVRQEKFRAEIPLDSREPDELARGLGQALHEVALRLRNWLKGSD